VVTVRGELLQQADGLVGVPGCQRREREALPYLDRDRGPGAEVPGTAGGQVPPVAERGADHPCGVEVPADPDQQRVPAGCPQRLVVIPPDAQRALPERLLEPGLGPVGRPDLGDRVGRRLDGPADLGSAHDLPHRCLQGCGHPYRTDLVGGLDGDEADLLEVAESGADAGLVSAGHVVSLGAVSASGLAGQHGAGDPAGAEHRGQLESRPDQLGGRELHRPLGGQHPGRGQRVGPGLPGPGPPVPVQGEPVLPAVLAGVVQVAHRQGQRNRQAAYGDGQVERARRPVRVVVEPVRQEVQSLARAERGHADPDHLRGGAAPSARSGRAP
jgi:hypothetical protein